MKPERVVLLAMRARRSVRQFSPKTVSRATVDRLLRAALMAPSSLGARPWRFVLIRDRRTIAEIVEAKRRFMPIAKRRYPADFMLSAPWVIVVCVDERRSFERGIENAVLAASHIMLLAASMGLGTTYLSAGRPGHPALERAMRGILKTPAWLRPCVLLPVGYPARPVSRRALPALGGRVILREP